MAVRVTVQLDYASPMSADDVGRSTNNDLKVGMLSEEYVKQNDEGTVWNVIRTWEAWENHVAYATGVRDRNNATVATTSTFINREEV